jgi:hypothetical protein
MEQYQEYLTRDEILQIQQHITDVFGEDYLQPHEYHQLFNQIANSILHQEDDEMFINNI